MTRVTVLGSQLRVGDRILTQHHYQYGWLVLSVNITLDIVTAVGVWPDEFVAININEEVEVLRGCS